MTSSTTVLQPNVAHGMAARAEDAATLLRAMANPQRLRVLCLLLNGDRSVSDLNSELDLSQSALSQHLAVLRAQGLVTTRREAQQIYYALARGPAELVLKALYDIYCSP